MSIDSQLLNLTGGIKTSGHIKSNFGATVGIGTDAPTGIVEVQHSQPTLVVQQQATSGASVTSYGKVHAASGTLHIQSGVDATSDSKGDIVLGSVGSGTKHVVVKGATSRVGIGSDAPAYGLDVVPESRFAGNVITSNISANILTLNELSLGVTQGLDNVVNVDNTTANTIAMSNVDESTSTTTGALTVAGGIGVGGNVHCSNLYASNITMNLVSFSGLQTFEQVVNNGRVLDSNVLIISNATPSTSSTTGALTLTGGGLGVAGNVHVGTAGEIVVSNAAPATSSTTGAVQIAGGLGVAGNVHVGSNTALANISVTGETVEVANLAVTSGSLELTQVANVFQVKSSANVVTEYVRSKKLIKYPRVALTSAAGESSGYQGYYVTESSNSHDTNRHSWKAFDTTTDLSTADNAWANDQNTQTYNGTDYAYVGSFNLGTGAVNGEWIKLQLPIKIKLQFIKIWLRSNDSTRIPEDWRLYGSSDNTNWTNLLSVTGQASINENLYEVDTMSMYDYFAVVVTKISGQNNYFRIVELEYYGIPEYDPDAHGTDVIARSIPNVPNTDWLEVYYDGQDYTSMPSSVTDKSGNSVTGTPSGVIFDSTWKAFSFDGNDDISATIDTTTGAWVHSSAFWVYVSQTATNTVSHFVAFGNESTNNASAIRMNGFDVIRWYFWGSDISFKAFDFKGRWTHVVGVYDGGNKWGSRKVFVNGTERRITETAGTEGALNLLSTSVPLRIGSRLNFTERLDGKIANFRLFNRALTADEVWQLYAYQKDYFKVSPDVVTFKGGRLGIGTLEPRAVLDVRGSVQMPGFSRASGTGGNTVYTNSKYVVHKFTSSGTFTVNEPGLIEYIVVGGGGGGGSRHHGGGGGGGVLVGTMYASKGDYTVTVGSGGNGNAGGSSSGQGNHGNDSTFAGLIGMRGGGATAHHDYGNVSPYIGCSGGTNATNSGNNVEIVPHGYGIQGWNGGRGNPTAVDAASYAGGGGGGAGGAGGNALPQGNTNTSGGVGGPGRCIYGLGADDSDVYLGGGGGGDCSASSSGSAGSGGIGGGGNGGKGNAQAGHGEANTGGGGGGGGFNHGSSPNGPGGNGGSGVVYVRYLK